MTKKEMELLKKVEELKELEALIKEAEKEVEELKNKIKKVMDKDKKEEISCGGYIIRYKEVSTDKFDSKEFKVNCPDIYKMYIKHTVSKRFTINW